MPSTYQELSLSELSNHPVKLGFEFEIASRQNHDAVGESLRQLFGPRSVGTVSSGYNAHHNSGYDKWNVTGDSSIQTSGANCNRVEIVSPILTPENCARTLESLFTYLRDKDALTNSSTGMHITVSHPKVSSSLDTFDALKFGLLIDDIGMTSKYRGALENQYANSLLHLFCKHNRASYNEGRIRRSDVSIPWSGDPELLFLLTSKEPKIRRCLVDIDKYRSINLSKVGNSLVEVRSPGGDYLTLGHQDAIKTAQKILSALVHSVDPTAHDGEYKRLFLSMFDSRIKPRPRPVVHDSPAHAEFSLNGYQFQILFYRHNQTREIDGWDIRQQRALYVSRIKITAPIDRPERESSDRTIFNPVSNGVSHLAVSINFANRASESSYFQEQLNPLSIENHLRRGDYYVEDINSNVSDLRGLNQVEQAQRHIAAIRELLSSSESMFFTRAVLDISRVLADSVSSDCANLISSLIRPRNAGGTPASRTNIGHAENWRPVENYIANSIESHRQAAERARNIQGSDNFSTALQARLNHLRQANAGASNRISTSNNDMFRAAAQEAAGRPLPFDGDADEVVRAASSNGNVAEALMSCINTFSDEFGGTTRQDILFSLHNIITEGDSLPVLPLTASSARLELRHIVRQLSLFAAAIEANPRIAVALSARLAGSRSLSRSFGSVLSTSVNAVVPALASGFLDYETQRTVARAALSILIAVCRIYKVLGSIPSTNGGMNNRMTALRAFFEQSATTCNSRLSAVDNIPRSLTRHAARLARSVVEAHEIVRGSTDISVPDVYADLELLIRYSVLPSILRPTHVGRVRLDIAELIAARNMGPEAEMEADEEEEMPPF